MWPSFASPPTSWQQSLRAKLDTSTSLCGWLAGRARAASGAWNIWPTAGNSTNTDAELQQREDSVVQSFKRLKSKCDSYVYRGEPAMPPHDPSADLLSLKKDKLHQLHSHTLPQLQQQILALLLCTSKRHEDPGSQLNSIAEIQAQLDHTLTQIFSASYIACQQPLGYFMPSDDQHLQELKRYRLHGLQLLLRALLKRLPVVFLRSYQLIQLKPPSGNLDDRDDLCLQIEDLVHYSVEAITSTIKWLTGSEFEIVFGDFPDVQSFSTQVINNKLAPLLLMINLPTRTEDNSDEEFEPDTARTSPLREGTKRLARRRLIPVFKLSLLFFNKLYLRGTYRTRPPQFTNMSSLQLFVLAKLPRCVDHRLDEILIILAEDTAFEAVERLADEAEKLERLFEPSPHLIFDYIVPIIPDSDGVPARDDLMAWLTTWNTQITLAINNLSAASRGMIDQEEMS